MPNQEYNTKRFCVARIIWISSQQTRDVSLWYFVCYYIGHGKCQLSTVPMVLRVLSHWTWKVSIVHCAYGTSCVIALDMESVNCPLCLRYFVCYHNGHEKCPLSTVPMVLRVLSHWTWNVSTVHCPYDSSCVITLDMKSFHCPLRRLYFLAVIFAATMIHDTTWQITCYNSSAKNIVSRIEFWLNLRLVRVNCFYFQYSPSRRSTTCILDSESLVHPAVLRKRAKDR